MNMKISRGGLIMERHIGLWDREYGNKTTVAELIIDGNHIEFYNRDVQGINGCAYIGGDGTCRYKVFTNGAARYGKYRTLDNAASYRTFYVLKQNCDFQKGLKIEGIKEASFIIPELVDWLDICTIDWGATEQKEMIAIETKLPNIILKAENPKIEIYFEAGNSLYNPDIDDRIAFEIRNQPRVRIVYKEPSNVEKLHSDIRAIMQFFGLMIGHITDALDIRLDIQNQDLKSWLYINEDFSYNLRTMPTIDRPRTKLKTVEENINRYFESWYYFYYDDKFELIRRMYFEGNKRKDIYAQDILVQYVRILEGYHLRITNEEEIASTLDKDIKDMIFTDDGKKLFVPIFEKAGWTFNSKHAKKVASWIASGFILKTTLSQRLKDLDSQHFDIIAKNADDIARLEIIPMPIEQKIPKDFNYFQRIVDTRNYYSHYKADDKNVLNFTQMCNTINILKALIIMILYTHMGMTNDEARKIIIWDEELSFQTMCLRKEGELPNKE